MLWNKHHTTKRIFGAKDLSKIEIYLPSPLTYQCTTGDVRGRHGMSLDLPSKIKTKRLMGCANLHSHTW